MERRKVMLSCPRLMSGVFAAFIFTAGSVSATIIQVPYNYPRVQLAIEVANSGDTVLVAAGRYAPSTNGEAFPINMKNGVRLLGAGADVCTLDAEQINRVIYCDGISDPATTIDGFTITNGDNGIFCCHYSSPTITNNTIAGNNAQHGGGIYCISQSSPTITNNTIAGNSVYHGGGISCHYQSSPTITNNIITENSASYYGGGIDCYGQSSPTITNNTIARNNAQHGGGICCYNSSPIIINNTITENSSIYLIGGGICCYAISLPTIAYDDVWGNIPENYWYCSPETGCSSADPLFVDPTIGDYHLQPGSPCIDAGNNNAPGLPEFDFDGNPRIIDGNGDGIAVVDMSAFEYRVSGDDVGPISINAPSSSVLGGITYSPRATVRNFGTQSVSFDVACEVDSSGTIVYADTVDVVNLRSDESIQVSFAGWTAGLNGGITYIMTVVTLLEDDVNPHNDMRTKIITTALPTSDVGTISIAAPPGSVWADITYTPQATVKNFGTQSVSFDVACQFDSSETIVYADTVSVAELRSGDSAQIDFAYWTAGPGGGITYTMTVTTLLEDDVNPDNNTMAKTITAASPTPDLDIQDYSENLSANTMELTGVRNSIVVGSYVLVNPDDWEKNVDLYDGPGNIDLDLGYSCTDLMAYGETHSIPASFADPDVLGVSELALGTAAQNIVQVHIPPMVPPGTYVGTVAATGSGLEFSDSDEFTLKLEVVPGGGPHSASFCGDPVEDGNRLYWTQFGLGETGFNIYRSEPNTHSFSKLNESPMTLMEYKDSDVMPGETYQYKLGLSLGGSSEILLGPISLATIGGDIPVLAQNRPNPWKVETSIRYAVPANSKEITLKIYNIAGELVKTLVEGSQEPGFHTVLWDGKDEAGKGLSSGVYFYKLTTGNLSQTRKMLLLR